jgi:hypothetical protein
MSSGSQWPVDLEKDTWALAAQWTARPDDLSSLTDRLLAFLTGVASLDPALTRWFDNDEPVPIEAASLRDRLESGWDREHPSGETGTRVALWNGAKDDLSMATISASVGSTAGYLKNRIEFRPPRPAAAPGLYQRDTMLALFETVISAWQPQWCRVQPWALRDATDGEFVDILASWIFYLDRRLYTRRGSLPEEVSVIDGDVFVLAPTPAELRLSTIEQLREQIVFPDEWSTLR